MTQSVNIIVGGKEYTDFTSATVTKSIESLSGTFSFDATSTTNINFPIKVGSACQIVVQGTQVINGYIEKLSISYDASTHQIKVSGRERTADIIDSTLGSGGATEFKAPTTLKQITQKVLKELNLSAIKVIDNGAIAPFKQDSSATEYGTSAFEFLQKYAKKRQVLLTTDGDGNVVFTQAPTVKYNTTIILQEDSIASILRGEINFDDTKRFHRYLCVSQNNNSDSGDVTQYFQDPAAAVDTKGDDAIDSAIRDSRVYHFEADASSDSKTLTKRNKWEANFRRSQSKIWNYTVQGHMAEDDDRIWMPGYLVRVIDEFADLNSILLISTVTWTESLEEGTKTKMKLLTQDSFTEIVNKPEKEKKTKDEGIGQYFSNPTGRPQPRGNT